MTRKTFTKRMSSTQKWVDQVHVVGNLVHHFALSIPSNSKLTHVGWHSTWSACMHAVCACYHSNHWQEREMFQKLESLTPIHSRSNITLFRCDSTIQLHIDPRVPINHQNFPHNSKMCFIFFSFTTYLPC